MYKFEKRRVQIWNKVFKFKGYMGSQKANPFIFENFHLTWDTKKHTIYCGIDEL